MAGNPSTAALKSAGNIKTFTYRVAADAATHTPMMFHSSQPFTVTRCTVLFDDAGNNPVGTLALNKVTAVSTVAIMAAATAWGATAAATPVNIPISSAANAVCAAADIITMTWTKTSGTISVGTVVVEYFHHEA